MNIWRLMAHHENPDLAMAWTRQNGRIAIGWGKIGDLRLQSFHSRQDIGARIRRYYPQLNNSADGGSSLWNLDREVRKGDLVILSANGRRELVVEVEGDYEFASQIPTLNGKALSAEYQHQRRVRVTTRDAERLWHAAGAGPIAGQNARWTFIQCALPLKESSLEVSQQERGQTVARGISLSTSTPASILSQSASPTSSLLLPPVLLPQERNVGIEQSERSGRNNKLTGQIGEFLVCAELGRRGFIATPFSGNVPAFDVIATDEFCRTVPIQVKSSNSDNWPAQAQYWMDITLDEETGIQHLKGPKEISNPMLVYVCVSIAKPGSGNPDRFFILTKSDVQKACIKGYSEWMEKRGWKRPRSMGSFDCRYFIPMIEQFEDNWNLITQRIEATSITTSLISTDE